MATLQLTRLTLLFASSLIISGCATNISGDPRYPIGYVDGAEYHTTQALPGIAYRDLFGNLRSIEFWPPNSVPTVIHPHGEIIVIPSGTSVRVTSIQLEQNIEMGPVIWIFADVTSGPFVQARADVSRISIHERGPQPGLLLCRRDESILAVTQD
jgi:hypothetical protein